MLDLHGLSSCFEECQRFLNLYRPLDIFNPSEGTSGHIRGCSRVDRRMYQFRPKGCPVPPTHSVSVMAREENAALLTFSFFYDASAQCVALGVSLCWQPDAARLAPAGRPLGGPPACRHADETNGEVAWEI